MVTVCTCMYMSVYESQPVSLLFYIPCLTQFNTFKLVFNDFLPNPGTGTRKLTFKETIHIKSPGRHDCSHRIRPLPSAPSAEGSLSSGQSPALWTDRSHRATEGISCEEAVLKTPCVCGCAPVQRVCKLRQTWVPVTLPSPLFLRGEESLVWQPLSSLSWAHNGCSFE